MYFGNLLKLGVMMDLLLILIVSLTLLVGVILGKRAGEKGKWGDKKKLLDEKWKNELNEQNNEWKLKFEGLDKDWKMKYASDLAEIKDMIKGSEKYLREDAVKRSRRTIIGKMWEQVSPYLPKFPYNPSDMKFMGAPIDFVIFDGMGKKDIKKVIFLEVKSGKSTLNSQERQLKKVIEAKKIKWELFNTSKPEQTTKDHEETGGEDETIKPNVVYEHIDEKITRSKKGLESDEEYAEDD